MQNLEKDLKKFFDAILENSNYSDLDLYKDTFENRLSIFESILDDYFNEKEGRCCSHDKSSHTAKLVEKTLKDGKYYSLKETYREYQAKGGNIGNITKLDEVAYWCPKTLETTEDALKVLFGVISSIKTLKLQEDVLNIVFLKNVDVKYLSHCVELYPDDNDLGLKTYNGFHNKEDLTIKEYKTIKNYLIRKGLLKNED